MRTIVTAMLLLTAATTIKLSGQAFQSFATTEDGSVLYFSSPIRQQGSDQSFHPKVFRWDVTNGFGVVAEQRDKGEFDGCNYPNFYQLGSPSISADGATLAYTAFRQVGGARVCPALEPNQGVIRIGTRETKVDGITAISRNGRYAFRPRPQQSPAAITWSLI